MNKEPVTPHISENSSNRGIFIIAIFAAIAALKLASAIIMPLTVALLLSFVLNPWVNWLNLKLRFPRFVGVTLVILIVLGFTTLAGFFLYASINSLVEQYPLYAQRYADMVAGLEAAFSFEVPEITALPWQDYLLTASTQFMSVLGYLTLILFFLFFLLLEAPYFSKKLKIAFEELFSAKLESMVEHTNSQIARYLTVKVIISLITAVLVFIVFSILGVDFALIWAVLAFLLNFIPNVGSILVGVGSFLFAIIQFAPQWETPILVGALMLSIQMLMGNIIEPQFQGGSLDVSPVAILFSLLLWGWLWGIPGMLIAVPMAVIIKIICENVPSMHWLAVLMSGKKSLK